MIEYSNILIRIVGAFLILIIGLIASNIISNILRKFLRGTGISKTLQEQLKLKLLIENYVSSIIKYLIYLITAILVLNELGVPTKILQLILVIFVIIITIFIIFAFKDWLPNIISGFYILKAGKIKVNDIIQVNGVKGKVLQINLLETKIETNNNELIFIPNSNITKYELIMEKKNGKGIRIDRN